MSKEMLTGDLLRFFWHLGNIRASPVYMKRATVDCNAPEWAKQVHSHLYGGIEVDLINFEYDLHGGECEWLVRGLQAERLFEVEFLPDRDPSARAARFRLRKRS